MLSLEHKAKVRITAVRRRTIRVAAGALPRARCAACGREVETLTRSQAGEILEVGDQELGAFLAAGRVHTIPTVSGSLRVCKESLFAAIP
ncbi:MAG: hypothetical protein H0U18_03475 [Pyrinomonadaceae bacterium]|nr:hypothetical protein [Pyrinomonadaceae bacterium]